MTAAVTIPAAAVVAAVLAERGALLSMRVARRTGFLDRPGGYKAHQSSTPYLGGAAVILAFLITVIALIAVNGARSSLVVVLACTVVLAVVGTIDDRRTVAPKWRLLVELATAVAIWSVHSCFSFGSSVLDLGITIVWVVGVVNAFNLIDNIDGACATLAAVSAAGIGVVGLANGHPRLAAVSFALAGACLGFLRHNLAKPARIFLGDGGSMPLGFLVAVLGMSAIHRHHGLGMAELFAAGLLVGIPVLDTTLVVISRRRRGLSVLTGGRDHLTHRLLAKLKTPRRVALVLAVVQSVIVSLSASFAVLAERDDRVVLIVFGVGSLALGAIALVALESLSWMPQVVPTNSGAARSAGSSPASPLLSAFDGAHGEVPPHSPPENGDTLHQDDRSRAGVSSSSGIDATSVRVLRVIARLNVGGPAIQAISLTRLLQPHGYATILVRGTEDADEGSMDHLAERLGVCPLHVPALRRNPGWHDLRALIALYLIIARERPQIVHTHAAKAGTLGRLAALLAPGRSKRVLVHTFHGHSLSGYFSLRTARVYLAIERFLAKRTTRLIAVSEEVRDELVEMSVAPSERFEVVRLGFDLSPFLLEDPERAERGARLRAELGIPFEAQLVTLIARLVPIKRVDRFLRVAVQLADRADVRFLIVGDGELRESLLSCEEALALGERVKWTGFRRDIPDVCFASDVIALTSDNEGTPVSLIEALAAGTPVVSTNVGGVASVVRDGHAGLLAHPGDEQGLAEAIMRLLDDAQMAERLAREGQRHALQSFGQERLVEDLDGLYRRLLAGI